MVQPKKPAVVLIHGYAGGLFEVEPLRQYLDERGMDVFSVLLAGHGADRKTLSRFGHKDWVASAREQVSAVAKQYSTLYFVGFSMGGLICAALIPEFWPAKLTTVNTPINFWNRKLIMANLLNGIRRRDYSRIAEYVRAALKSSPRSLTGFLNILLRYRNRFADARCPALIIQTLDDDTTQPKSAAKIKAKIGPTATVKTVKTGGHLVFLSPSSSEVCREIYHFLAESGDNRCQ